ncbi:MAG TPA: 4Fe-4S ferredoxin [Coriobacteriia bacterium]|nr:4Fe-4S ferredoxin [Coriobacteriia bacterium]
MAQKYAFVERECVACGTCVKACPRSAMTVYKGVRAGCDAFICAGCGTCAKACPAAVIQMISKGGDE